MKYRQSYWRIYLSVGLVAAVTAGALVLLSSLNSYIVRYHDAYMAPCMELNEAVFNARLMLDGIIAGDPGHDLSDIQTEISRASDRVEIMLHGGSVEEGDRVAVVDDVMKGSLEALQRDLMLLKDDSKSILDLQDHRHESKIHHEYHKNFTRIIKHTREIESRARDIVREKTSRVDLIERLMLGGVAFLACAGALLLRSGIRRIKRGERALSEANLHLQEAESSLRTLSDRNENILATVPEIIMEVDENKVYTWANEAGYKFFGRDVIGKTADYYFAGEQLTYKHVEPLFAGAEDVVYLESWQRRADGMVRLLGWWCRVKKDSDGRVAGALSTARDITDENVTREEREATIKLLKLINKAGDKHELFRLVTVFMHEWSGCEAVGIRLNDGDDFPYFETAGFSDDFVQKESCLCQTDADGNIVRDEAGDPVLECMCGNILKGRFDPALPFFTKHGSFWTNSTTDLLASTSEKDRQARTRNRCHGEGYESVALIPLRHQGETLGLLQFNDKRRDRFTVERIEYLENIAWNLAVGISQRMLQEKLEKSEKQYRGLVDSTPDIIMRFDRKYRHLFVSKSVSSVTDWLEPEDFIGKTHAELGFDPEQCRLWEDSIHRVFEAGKPFETEFDFVNKQGRVVFDWRLFPEFGEDGKVATVLSISRDITRHREIEAQYASIFRSMLDGMAVHEMIWDDNGEPADYRFITVNPAFEQMTGLKLNDIAGKTVKEVLPVTEEAWIQAYGEVVKTGKPAHFDSFSAGLNKHFEVTAYRNAPNQFTVLAMDVTAAKKAERALQESELRYRLIFEGASQGIMLVEIETRKIKYANRTAADMFGYAVEELPGMLVEELHPEEEVEHGLKNLEEASKWVRTHAEELIFMRKDGSVFPAEVTTRAMKVDGRDCLVEFLNDISHRKQLELQKEQLIQSDKLASLGTLVAGVAHEINNPNSFIMLNAPNLQDMWDDMMPVVEESCRVKGSDKVGLSDLVTLKETGPRLLKDILKGSERIKKIVSELKLFARQDDAEMRQDVDVNEVVESAISLTHNRIKNATNDFKVRRGADLPRVKGNYQRLEQVVINLLINACDALPSRSHGIMLETITDEDRMIVVIRVRDQGTGMSKEVLARIKDPFFTTKRDRGGTGLGLSISSGVIAEHDGVLTFESEQGKGTVATVVLPAWVEHCDDA